MKEKRYLTPHTEKLIKLQESKKHYYFSRIKKESFDELSFIYDVDCGLKLKVKAIHVHMNIFCT